MTEQIYGRLYEVIFEFDQYGEHRLACQRLHEGQTQKVSPWLHRLFRAPAIVLGVLKTYAISQILISMVINCEALQV